jgi:alpha-tubulin suppressor-like RCC1 family protein
MGVVDLGGKKAKQVCCGNQHTACLTEDGDVLTWGLGRFGALGHKDAESASKPKKVEGLANIIKIECGSDYTVAMDKDGKLYSFGSNTYGQLGITGAALKSLEPSRIFVPLSQGKVSDFSCGDEHAAYVNVKGDCYTWGYGADGQLGHDNKTSLNTPKKLDFEHKVGKVVCGGGHTGLITEQGDLYLMGRGRNGQLGIGNSGTGSSASNRMKPTLVEHFKTNDMKITHLALGTEHTLVASQPKQK